MRIIQVEAEARFKIFDIRAIDEGATFHAGQDTAVNIGFQHLVLTLNVDHLDGLHNGLFGLNDFAADTRVIKLFRNIFQVINIATVKNDRRFHA